MKTYEEFILELKRNNFQNVRDISEVDAFEYFSEALTDLGYDIEKDFPNFKKNFVQVRKKVRKANTPRKKMPVIKSADISKFLEYVRKDHGTGIRKTRMKANSLIPMQNQVYLDNPIAAIKRHSLKGTMKFAKTDSHSVVSNDNYIMDGNHRWLLVMLYDPNTNIHAYQVDMDHEELKRLMDNFTDNVIKRKRNESILSR